MAVRTHAEPTGGQLAVETSVPQKPNGEIHAHANMPTRDCLQPVQTGYAILDPARFAFAGPPSIMRVPAFTKRIHGRRHGRRTTRLTCPQTPVNVRPQWSKSLQLHSQSNCQVRGTVSETSWVRLKPAGLSASRSPPTRRLVGARVKVVAGSRAFDHIQGGLEPVETA